MQLLTENKFSRYLIYAAGEIVLVVIGILMALSINNGKEQNKNLAKEQLILKQLRSEYQNNLAQLDEKILMRKQGIEAAQYLLNLIDNPTLLQETELYESMFLILRDPTFDPIKNDILESDNLRLLKNDTLVRALSNWSTEVYQVQEIELIYVKFRTEMLFPCYNRLGLSRNVIDAIWKNGYSPTESLDKSDNAQLHIQPTKKKLNLDDILQDDELEGNIAITITLYQMANFQSNTLRKRITYMLEVINSEII